MNSISWFLYWIEVVGSLGAFLFIVAGCSAAATAICLLAYAMAIDFASGSREENLKASRKIWITRLVVTSLICGLAGCFFPSKNTMYAMAASEVGERVVKSEAVQGMASDATKALQQWIRRQIEPEKNPSREH